MRSMRIAFLCCLVATVVTPCWAQFGLYGSPEVLRMPQSEREAMPLGGYATQAVYPAAPANPATYPAARGQTPYRPYVQAVATDPTTSASAGRGVPQMTALAEPSESPVMSSPSDAKSKSVVQQMTDDAGGNGCYTGPLRMYGQAASDGCGDGCNNVCADACGGCRSPWYGGVSALVMTRDQPNRIWFSHENNNDVNQLQNNQNIEMQWKWGGEIHFGRRFCCDQWAIEASYWSLDPFNGYNQCLPPTANGLGTPLQFSQVQFNGQTAENWFGAIDPTHGAVEHRLYRRNEFHDVEINLVRNRMLCGCDSPWGIDWLAGVRFFRFDESLTFASLRNGCTWGQGAGEAYMNDQITNNLWGFQFGFNADYCVARNLKLFAGPRFGIYNNHINHSFNMYLGDGTVATTGGTGVPGTYPVNSTGDNIAFLTQLDLGVDWQFAPRWSARIGYRVLAATGIGLADNQLPQYMVDIPEIAHIDTNGQLIMHGAFMGITYNF
jgi:hypothetical protein